MKAAIVILNYNGKEMLRQFLPSVIEHSIFPVIIADNASDDGSVDFLKETYPDLEVLTMAQNTGYAGGYNHVLFLLSERFQYFILLNSDVAVTAGWDGKVVEYLEQHSEVAVAQPKILSLQTKHLFDYAGACGGYLDSLGYPYCRGRVLHSVEEDHGQYDQPREVDWASGACLFIRSKIFVELGGFRTEFFAHMEEIDLCWRIRKRGWRLMVLPESKVYHLGGGTLAKTNAFKTYLNFRNSLLMLYINLQQSDYRGIMMQRYFLDAAAGLHLLFSQGWSHGKAVWKAYRDFYKMRNAIKKDSVLASKLSLASSEKKVSSIIWNYYFQGKKKFSQL
jgi:GT2 family glycosyltransferase